MTDRSSPAGHEQAERLAEAKRYAEMSSDDVDSPYAQSLIADLLAFLAVLPPVEPPLPVPLAAIQDAAALAESESNRHPGKTGQHWQDVATALRGYQLACEVRADLAAPVVPEPPQKELRESEAKARAWMELYDNAVANQYGCRSIEPELVRDLLAALKRLRALVERPGQKTQNPVGSATPESHT